MEFGVITLGSTERIYFDAEMGNALTAVLGTLLKT
jgi:hypothetical protein